jgi:protein-disulfide isomerase
MTPPMTPMRAALCVALLLTAGACTKAAANDKAFDEKVHAYLLAHPEVLLEMQDAYVAKQANTESTQVRSRLAALRTQVFDDPRDPSVGPKDAKVTVVEFSDYRCPHCKDAAPDVLALIKAHPDVRFVFKELPIFGPQSQAAAAAAIATYQEAHGKYLDVYRDLMADHDVDADSIDQILAKNGLESKRTLALAADPKIAAQIADISHLAASLGVDGTPGFLINDQYVSGADIPALKKAIETQQKG